MGLLHKAIDLRKHNKDSSLLYKALKENGEYTIKKKRKMNSMASHQTQQRNRGSK